MYLIVDAHEDLAWNMRTFGRDYTRGADETRRLEAGGTAQRVNGDTLLGYPEYLRARVGLIFATLFAAPLRSKLDESDTQVYRTDAEARDLYRAQMDDYRRLVETHPEKFRWSSAPELEAHLGVGKSPEPVDEDLLVGLVRS
jgi:membrane dipeptidase